MSCWPTRASSLLKLSTPSAVETLSSVAIRRRRKFQVSKHQRDRLVTGCHLASAWPSPHGSNGAIPVSLLLWATVRLMKDRFGRLRYFPANTAPPTSPPSLTTISSSRQGPLERSRISSPWPTSGAPSDSL